MPVDDSNTSPKPVLILGGGITGLVTAWKLAKAGRTVTMLEGAEAPGGLARTVHWDGFYFDHGAHNFFTFDKGVHEFYEQVMPGVLQERKRRFKLFIFGKLLDFPFLGSNLLKAMKKTDLLSISIPFAVARVKAFFLGLRETRYLDEWIIMRYGRALYRVYFEPYLRRVQQCDPHELSSAIGTKKIMVMSLRTITGSLLKQLAGKTPAPNFKSASYYARHGYGSIPQFFFREVNNMPNFTYRGGERLVAITEQGNDIVSITTTLGTVRTEGWDIISTIPLEQLLRFSDGAHGAVQATAQRLQYVGMRFLLVKVKRPEVTGCWFVNFNDERMPFYRVGEEAKSQFDMVPDGYSSLTFEIPVNKGDGLAAMPDAELLPLIIERFSIVYPLDIADVDGCTSLYADHANPRLIVGYQDILEQVFGFILSMNNLFSLGRQGLFTYANLDHCTRMALDFSDAYLAGSGKAGNRELLRRFFKSGF